MVEGYDMQRATGWICLLLVWAMAFVGTPPSMAQMAVPEFDVDVVGVQGKQGAPETRVDVYTKVPYAHLQFIKGNEGFTASYEISAEFFTLTAQGKRGNRVQSHVWERTVTTENFAATQSDHVFDPLTQSLTFAPGRYLLEIQLEDRVRGEAFVRELPLLVRPLNKPIAVSDLILLDEYDARENTITPTVGNRIGTDQEHFRLFYEIYARQPDRISVTREVVRLNKSNGPPSAMAAIFGLNKDDDELGEVSFTRAEMMPVKTGRTQLVVEIPMRDLKAGDYLVRVKVSDESNRVLDAAEKVVQVHWTGLAEHIRNLDDAIKQLQYIAKDKEVRYILDGRSENERLTRFMAFWKRRDPTPATERNEHMEEYYYRIDYANREYGSLVDGWKTDRGNVMIRFGEPDYVERHPFNYDTKPYEVWYYYRIGRRFIFVDKTGLGDYELWVPYWDERTRIR